MKAIEDRTAAQLDKQIGDEEVDELDNFAQQSEQVFVVNPLTSALEAGILNDPKKMEELRRNNTELTLLQASKQEMDRERIQLTKSTLTLQKRMNKIKDDTKLLDELTIRK